MVAAISQEDSTNPPQENPKRKPPLIVSSEKDSKKESNVVNNNQRKPRSKQVSSRYMSPSPSTSTTTTTTSNNSSSCFSSSTSSSTSRRFASPLNLRSSNCSGGSNNLTPAASIGPKRSVSVDRRRSVSGRPMTPVLESKLGNAGEVMGVSAAAKLLTTSTRSLSVSFQGEAFSLPVSKAKTPSLSSVRKGTPERRKVANTLRGKVEVGDRMESPKPGDQHRWPGRTREMNSLSKSIDWGVSERRLDGSGLAVKGLQPSMVDESRSLIGGRLSLDLGSARYSDSNLANEFSMASDPTASDTDSVSSGSNSGLQDTGSKAGLLGRSASRGIAVSARFWQETNSRLRRLQDPGSPLSMSPGSRIMGPPKFSQCKRFSSDCSPLSIRSIPSPTRGASRPASPSKFMTPLVSSPSRGNPSPSRVRNSVSLSTSSDFSNAPSFFSYSVDHRRGKSGDNRVVDAQLLRLLYNRYLQWRFVNARADAVYSVQRRNAEKNLWNGWIAISELRRSVTVKRSKLQLLRQKLKLASILRGQMPYMEEWAPLDGEHSNALLEATKALKESTLRVPVVGRAIADIQKIKDAVGSAVDAMNTTASSIWSRLSKMEEMNSIMSELVSVTNMERALLNQCKDLLSLSTAMQVQECSLKTHTLQLSRELTTRSLTTRVQN